MSSDTKSKSASELLNKVPAKVFWISLLVIFISFAAISFVGTPERSNSSKAKAISRQLRCLECEGLSVYESETQTSKSIVADVKRRVESGQSESKILSHYEGIYGEYILLNPSTGNGNWLIYLFPLFGALVLIAAILISIKSNSKQLKIGFWAGVALVVVVGFSFYISDINNSKKENKEQITTQDNADSIEKLKEAAELDPSNKNLRSLAIVQFAQEEYIDALKNFDVASKLDESDAVSRGYASYIIMLSGEYGLALDRAQAAVAANPQEPVALFFRGLIYYSIPAGNTAYVSNAKDLANADFDKVLELAPNSDFASQINDLRS